MSRVLRWMDKAMIQENAAILDIGTGNGAFLVEMVWGVEILFFNTSMVFYHLTQMYWDYYRSFLTKELSAPLSTSRVKWNVFVIKVI